MMHRRTIGYLKENIEETLREINRDRGTMIITENGEDKAVVMDITLYERIQEAIALLEMTARGQKDVEDGKTVPADLILSELDELIKADFPKPGE